MNTRSRSYFKSFILFTVSIAALAIALTFCSPVTISRVLTINWTSSLIRRADNFQSWFTWSKPAVSTSIISSASISSSSIGIPKMSDAGSSAKTKTPVYFLSHGGPNIMYDVDHPVFGKLQKIGKEITTQVKPKAIVAFSAHWQADRDVIEVNTAEVTDLIYDFYGFPSHYYKAKFPNVGSASVAQNVMSTLKSAGIASTPVKRGLDHGIWACFNVAFNPEENPLRVPIVAVSMFSTEDASKHIALGEALQSLREQGILIVVSGMAVHNLRDLRMAWGRPTPMPYAVSFDAALKDAIESATGEERKRKMVALMSRSDLRGAHPTVEHLLPIFIGAGAAGDDKGVQTWTKPEGSMSWAQYRFGEVPKVK